MTEQGGTELLYRYAIPSQVRRADNSSELLLGTSGGITTETTEDQSTHPYFFKGFLTQPAPAVAGMLACAAIARASYYYAPGERDRGNDRRPGGDRLRWGKHRGTRGPCKHVLAARMAARPDEP